MILSVVVVLWVEKTQWNLLMTAKGQDSNISPNLNVSNNHGPEISTPLVTKLSKGSQRLPDCFSLV
jgi:hypothetical protein